MSSLIRPRVKSCLCLLTCLGLACLTAVPPAIAANPYEKTNQTEGDPGDGVLRPRIDQSGGGGSGMGSGFLDPRTRLGNAQIPATVSPRVFDLLAIYLPGYGVITFPRQIILPYPSLRGWYNAP